MSMRFRWLSGALVALVSCLSIGCAKASRNIPSTHDLYVASSGSSQIWGFRANFFTGALSLINGAPFPFPSSGRNPGLIVVDSSKNFAYVSATVPPGTTCSGSQSATTTFEVQTFSIDANGSFAPASGCPVSLNAPVTAMTLDATGKYLLVATGVFQDELGRVFSSSINVYSISTGVLTQVGSSVQVNNPFGSLAPVAVALAEQAPLNLIYVADQNNGFLVIYSFDPTTGALSVPASLPPVAVGLGPSAISIDSTGRYLYVANRDSSNVDAFTIAPSNQSVPGSLQPIGGSPVAVGAGGGPVALAVDPSAKFLYVLDHDTNQLWAFKITADTGALTPVTASPFSTGSGPTGLIFSPTNRYLYVTDTLAGTVEAKGVDPTTGNLGAGAPVPCGINPVGIAVGR